MQEFKGVVERAQLGTVPGARLCPAPRGISRSRFAPTGRGNRSDASCPVNVLRLVEDDTAALRFGKRKAKRRPVAGPPLRVKCFPPGSEAF